MVFKRDNFIGAVSQAQLAICRGISMSLSDKIALGALSLSGIAFLVSVYSIYLQKRLNEINLQAGYFERIFEDYFVRKIPESARKLHFNSDNRLDASYRDLNLVMMHMIKDCAYFDYAKHDFYDKLCEMTKNLEERMINLAGNDLDSRIEQVKTIHSLRQDLTNIVKFINKNYMKA